MEQLQNNQAILNNIDEIEDEIDTLFMQLEPMIPPLSLVNDIMALVADLPLLPFPTESR